MFIKLEKAMARELVALSRARVINRPMRPASTKR
jgi:hypothetical protein